MFSKLVVVDGVNDSAGQPAGLTSAFGHDLLRERSEGVAVLLGSLRGNLQGAFGVRVVGRQQDSPVGFHRQNAVTSFQAEPVGHILRQGSTDGPASLTKRHLFGHAGMVAY